MKLRKICLLLFVLSFFGVAIPEHIHAMADVKQWINKIKPGTFPEESAEGQGEDAEKRPKTFTEAELSILTSLKQKEELLKSKEKEIQLKEKGLRTLEQQVERKLDQMKELAEKVEKERLAREEMDRKNIEKMVKFYETMDPENTAVFINQLDRVTAAQIIMRMNPRKASALMQRLDPKIAVEITEMVTGFRKK